MCNGNCNQGRNCDCDLRPARGIWSGLLISAVFWVSVWAIVMISGCTAIGHKEPPSDWPKLEVKVNRVGWYDMQVICGYGGLWTPIAQVYGCANINADTMQCNIYIAGDDEYAQLTIEHELEHCAGKDHIGSSSLADYWEEWKQINGRVK